MNLRLSIYLIFLSAIIGQAQELNSPQLSQYLADNPFVLSPTYAGIGDNIRLRLNGVEQWVGIKDAPATQTLAFDKRFGERSGAGIFLYNDKNGNTAQQGARLSFAHHLTLNRYEDEFLSFGLSFNFHQQRIQTENQSTVLNGATTVGNSNAINFSTSNYNFDLGFLYRFRKFFASVNVSNLLDKNLASFNPTFEPSKLRNYYLYTGYVYSKNKNSKIDFEPSLLFKYFESDGRSETDLNMKIRYKRLEDYFYVGLNYRFLNDQIGKPHYIAPFVGFKKNNFYFAYSVQAIVNEILAYSYGTHVITVGVDLFQGISSCRCTH